MKRQEENYNVGDILYNSWGYDQTNIDFYQIVKRTDKSIWIREIESQVVKQINDFSKNIVPVKNKFTNRRTERKLIRKDNSIKADYGVFRKYDGTPQNETSYC